MSDGKAAASGAMNKASYRAEADADGATVVGELIEATCAAVAAAVDEQKERAADKVAVLGEAVRRAGQSLEPAAAPMIAQYLLHAAGQIDAVSETIRTRSWSELAAGTADFARRQPALFLAATVAVGYLASRLWTTSAAAPTRQGFAPPEPVPSTPEIAGLPAGSDGSMAAGFDNGALGARNAD